MAVAKKLRGTLTTPELEIAITNGFDRRKNLLVPNVQAGMDLYECDLVLLRPTDYAVEFELKLTKSDLMKDFNKDHTHEHELIKEVYFVMPMNVVSTGVRVVPENYGIIGVRRNDKLEPVMEIIRPTIENPKARKWTLEERLQLLRLLNMRYWNLSEKLIKLRRETGR